MGLGGKLAMAAMFVIAGSIVLTSLNYLRYNSHVQQCKMQMGNNFRGLAQYISDYEGQPPTLAAAPGAPIRTDRSRSTATTTTRTSATTITTASVFVWCARPPFADNGSTLSIGHYFTTHCIACRRSFCPKASSETAEQTSKGF